VGEREVMVRQLRGFEPKGKEEDFSFSAMVSCTPNSKQDPNKTKHTCN
jgi:hypothetical protein